MYTIYCCEKSRKLCVNIQRSVDADAKSICGRFRRHGMCFSCGTREHKTGDKSPDCIFHKNKVKFVSNAKTGQKQMGNYAESIFAGDNL